MNKKIIPILSISIIIALIIGIFIGRAFFSGGDHAHADEVTAASEAAAAESTTWTCSMHPQIQQPEPGDCPICGMDLIPLESDTGANDGPRVMSMSESSRALANIQTTVVERDYPEAQIRLVGKLAFDATREKSLTARFPARIDELFVNFTGIEVKQGEHLAKVYSPELLIAQRELLHPPRRSEQFDYACRARKTAALGSLAGADRCHHRKRRGQRSFCSKSSHRRCGRFPKCDGGLVCEDWRTPFQDSRSIGALGLLGRV